MTPPPSASSLLLGVLSALLLLPEPASATPPPSSPTSESSVFAVTWGRARLARIDLKLGCPSRGIRPAALLATSEGFTEQIRPFRVRFDTFLDSSSRRSRQGRTSITEKGRTRAYRTSFRERDSSAIVHATIFGQTREPKTIAFASSPDDMLSWMLRARQELAFARDTTAHFLVWDGWKSFWLRMTVERIERIATPSGSYKAWRVRLERAIVRASERATTTPTSRDFPFERIAIAWFARAEGHPLLGMNYDAPIGTTRIRLSSYTRRACSKTPP